MSFVEFVELPSGEEDLDVACDAEYIVNSDMEYEEERKSYIELPYCIHDPHDYISLPITSEDESNISDEELDRDRDSFSLCNSEAYLEAEHINYTSSNSNIDCEGENSIQRCLVCFDVDISSNIMNCYKCFQSFCIPCAPPISIATLCCCDFHGKILWFCSEDCRDMCNADTVAIAYSLNPATCMRN